MHYTTNTNTSNVETNMEQHDILKKTEQPCDSMCDQPFSILYGIWKNCYWALKCCLQRVSQICTAVNFLPYA